MRNGKMLENGIVFFPVEIVRQRDGKILARTGRLIQNHDPVSIRIRKWTQQDGIDDAENGGVSADPERQRKHRD